MRQIRAFLLLLGITLAACSQCTLYFDDCQACLSDPECGWCGDYCSSRDSAICDSNLETEIAKCPSIDVPSKRQLSPSCTSKSCDECVAPGSGCVYCETVTLTGEILAQICIANTSAALCSSAYAPSGTQEYLVTSCPITPNVIFIIVFAGTGLDPLAIRNAIVTSFNSFIAPLNRGVALTYEYIIITDLQTISGTNAQRNLPDNELRQSQNTRVYFYGVTPNDQVYPQATLNADLQAWLDSLKLNNPLTPGGPNVVGKGTSNGGSSGSKDHLSGGDLAGIIVGVIIGAALLTALILWALFLRRKKGYPEPFRSPAANFRP